MKYKAIVKINDDPNKYGRIKVHCPSLWGDSLSPWCYPCFPFVTENVRLPKLGESVWIELTHNNVPVYVGTWGGEELWKSLYVE